MAGVVMSRSPVLAHDIVPVDGDLPGEGWVAIDDGFDGASGEVQADEVFDCVGAEFPEDDVVGTAASPHFVHPPGRLLHGVGVAFGSAEAAARATTILRATDFAECLSRSVAADLAAQPIDAELLAVDVHRTGSGHRVSFTGGDQHGVRPVHLDIAVLHAGTLVGLLWCGDTPAPFPTSDLDHVLERIRSRAGSGRI